MPIEPPTAPLKLDYSRPTPQRRTHWIAWVLLAGMGLLVSVAVIFGPADGTSRATANRVKCQSNLRLIGEAILLYSNDNNGQYPDDFQTLLFTEEITSEVFVCSESNDTTATGPTTQAIATNLATSGHLSYIYLGKGMNAKTISPDTVVAYEPLSNHANSGSNVLFGDGHVEFILAPAIKAMESAMKTKSGAVTLPSTP
jgi:prepilin-type processing-associated H-X9-DG protein